MTLNLTTSAINYDYQTNGIAYGVSGASNFTGSVNLFNQETIVAQHDYNNTKRGLNISDGTTTAYLEQSVDNIREYLEDGHEDIALESYQELLESMNENSLYSHLSDTDKQTYIKQIFEQQTGQRLEDCIRDNTSDNASTAYKKILYWGNADSTTQEELLESMCNVKSEKSHSNIIVDVLAAVVSPFTALGNLIFGGAKKK